jgi:hypothetical protein
MTTLQGLSDVEQSTRYVDYTTSKELLVIRRVLMQHDKDEEIVLNEVGYRVAYIHTDMKFVTDDYAGTFERSIYLQLAPSVG